MNELEPNNEPIPVNSITTMPLEGTMRIDIETLKVGIMNREHLWNVDLLRVQGLVCISK